MRASLKKKKKAVISTYLLLLGRKFGLAKVIQGYTAFVRDKLIFENLPIIQ